MTFSIGSLSSYQFNFFNRLNVHRATVDLGEAAKEVSSGKKADVYEALGPRAASVIKLRGLEENTQTYIQANEVLGNKLEAQLTAVDTLRDRLQSVIEIALSNKTRPTNGAHVLQGDARAAIESLVATLNTSYNGEHLFAGLHSDAQPLMRWTQTNATTGLSPEDVLGNIVGAGPTDAATATAIAADIDLAFASAEPVDVNHNFEATFYVGTPELDGGGQPNPQVSAWVASGQQVVYGVRANEEAFREAYKGLAMLASTDVSQMDSAAYEVWMGEVVDALSAGQQGMLATSAEIGFNQQIVETAKQRLTDLSIVQRTQITQFEAVDPYEAITRMTNLETQLQASYQVSSRLSGLSILNFLR